MQISPLLLIKLCWETWLGYDRKVCLTFCLTKLTFSNIELPGKQSWPCWAPEEFREQSRRCTSRRHVDTKTKWQGVEGLSPACSDLSPTLITQMGFPSSHKESKGRETISATLMETSYMSKHRSRGKQVAYHPNTLCVPGPVLRTLPPWSQAVLWSKGCVTNLDAEAPWG